LTPSRSALAAAIAALVLAAALALWVGASRRSSQPAPAPAVPVVADVAVARDLPVWIASVGTVQPLNVVNVRARVQGELLKLGFVEGQEVRAGQVLAQIDPRPFEAVVRQAEANLRRDEAQLAHARAEVKRYTDLAEKGFVAPTNVEALRAQASSLEATVQGDRAMLETANLNLAFTTITSPISGRAGLRQANAGAMIRDTDPNGLVTITQSRPISVLFSLPQDDLAEVLARRREGPLAVAVQAREGGADVASGDLSAIDNQVDTTTGQVKLKALFDNADGALWPGELVATRLRVRTERAATAVPARAVLAGRDGPYVYVVKADGTVQARAVTPGATAEGVIAIRKGLAPGEIVVIDGQSRLEPGARVEARKP